MPKPGQVVAFVDAAGFVRDAVVVSEISDGKAPLNALTVRTSDDGVEHSNVQHADERPAPSDVRVTHGHIDGGHWRAPTDAEAKTFAAHAERRTKRDVALANIDTTPKKDETPEQTRRRLAEAHTAILVGAPEPAPVVDETPWVGETAPQTKARIAAAQAAAAATH